MPENIRTAVIGIGHMGSAHARCIAEGKVPGMVLSAVCDLAQDRLEWAEREFPGVRRFADWRELLAGNAADAAVIAVPHPLHSRIADEALRAGLHVLSEKPLDIRVSDARKAVAAGKETGRVFAVMLNQRTNPIFQRARQIVRGGQLGDLKRSVWIITNWYRTQHYYDSGDWRATWSGEGGGVLLNQAPHNLDLWQWICGMPSELTAWCDVAKYHHIEVEDEATIFVRYPGGATGAFITSTGESPGTNRLEISGTRGKIVLEEGKLKFWRLKEDEARARFESGESMPHLPLDYEEWTPDTQGSGHAGILRNFADAVLHGTELLSPAEDGLFELMLSNAAYLSAWEGSRTVALPADEERFNRLLAERQLSSRRRDSASGLGKEVTGEYAERWQTRW